MFNEVGRLLIIVGAVFLAVGLILTFLPGLRFGRLPGDIAVRRGSWGLYFPIVSSIVLSVVLTLVLWIISSFRR